MTDSQHDRPPYQPWYEGDFWTLRVRTMHPCARLMYRSILQHAWDLNPPGQIPNDPQTIMTMADCWHPKIWEKHGASVMAMFDISPCGNFMTSARQLQELVKAYGKRSSYIERGKLGGRGNKNSKRKKTKDNEKAELKPSFPVAFSQQSNQPNPTQPIIKTLSSTSKEVDLTKLLSRYSEEEQCAVAEVWAFYLEKCERDPKRYELTPQRASKAVMRFKECRKRTGAYQGAVEKMKEAISNLAASDFHMGRDPKSGGKKFVDFVDHLFDSYTVMEKRWNMSEVAGVALGPRGPVNNAAADEELTRQLGRKATP